MIEEFEYNGKAMGTDYSISIVCGSKDLAEKLFEISVDEISKYEKQFSRFLSESELSVLNEKKEMVVSKFFLDTTQKAYELFVETKGIFNPLVQVSRFGYNKNFNDLEDNHNILNQEYYDIDFSTVVIDREKSFIRLMDGQKLDYGGFLKGYLAEIIATEIKLASLDIKGVIVNLGGDVCTKGLDKNDQKFIFQIYNPVTKNGDISISLYNQSLATSGTYKRNWLSLNRRMHHILDRSGQQNPQSDIISVSVVNQDGGRTEAYTKVFLSMDERQALNLLGDKNISFIIIKESGQIIKNI